MQRKTEKSTINGIIFLTQRNGNIRSVFTKTVEDDSEAQAGSIDGQLPIYPFQPKAFLDNCTVV